MILGATLLWSIEVVLARRVMTRVPAPTAAAARMGIGSVALVIWSVARGGLGEIGGVGAPEIAWVLTTGAILATFVALWYGALSRAPAVDVSAMLVPAVLVTAALRAGFDGVPVPAAPALVAIAVGTALVLVGSRRSRPDHVGAATGH